MQHLPSSRTKLSVPALLARNGAVLAHQSRVAQIETTLADVAAFGFDLGSATLAVLVVRIALLRDQTEIWTKQREEGH